MIKIINWIYANLSKRKLVCLLTTHHGLHVGCGSQVVDGWINIDAFSDPNLSHDEKQILLHRPNFILCDITKIWPFPKNSTSYIYSSHTIEHLSRQDAVVFLTNCYHALKEKGILRLSCPDVHLWTVNYLRNNKRFFTAFYHKWPSFPALTTPTDIFVGQFYGWDHKWMYDYNSLSALLRSAGFIKVAKHSFGKSSIPDILSLEPKERRGESLYIEAQK